MNTMWIGLCVEKIKSITVLLTLLHYFYHGIQCDKTPDFVHGEAFGVQHEIFEF